MALHVLLSCSPFFWEQQLDSEEQERTGIALQHPHCSSALPSNPLSHPDQLPPERKELNLLSTVPSIQGETAALQTHARKLMYTYVIWGWKYVTSVPVCFETCQCYLVFLKGSKNIRFETVIQAFTAITMNHNETC